MSSFCVCTGIQRSAFRKRKDDDVKPGSVEDLLAEDDKDREWWEIREELNDLSQPARNVSEWITPLTRPPVRVRPKWAWWPVDGNANEDPSLNIGLVSPGGGTTVSRLMTQEVSGALTTRCPTTQAVSRVANPATAFG